MKFFSLDVESRQVMLNLRGAKKLTKRAVNKAFKKLGSDLAKDAKKLILKKPKHGRLYRIKGKLHRASAPQEAPANLTGNLRKNIKYTMAGGMKMHFGVDSRVKYGKFLELGTAKMEKRPYLIKSIRKNEKKAEQHFKKFLTSEISMGVFE